MLVFSKEKMVRRWRQQTEFSGGELTHDIVVPPEPTGRPGERFKAPSLSLHPPRIGKDGARQDFRVLLDEHGSTLTAVCFGPIADHESPEESCWRSLTYMLRSGREGPYTVTPERIVGKDAFRYSMILMVGPLTEWKLEHLGWLYGIGVLELAPWQAQGQPVDVARRVLDTWEWLPETGAP